MNWRQSSAEKSSFKLFVNFCLSGTEQPLLCIIISSCEETNAQGATEQKNIYYYYFSKQELPLFMTGMMIIIPLIQKPLYIVFTDHHTWTVMLCSSWPALHRQYAFKCDDSSSVVISTPDRQHVTLNPLLMFLIIKMTYSLANCSEV